MKFILFFCLLIGATTYAQTCNNLGFESGNTAGWTCGSGTCGTTGSITCDPTEFPVTINYNGNCLNQGGINGTNTPSNVTQNRHTIINTTSMDPNSLNSVSCTAPGSLFPNSINKYSLRLGNGVGTATPGTQNIQALAEGIKCSLTVEQGNAGLTFMYALFMKEDTLTPHPAAESPRFIVKVTDATNKLIDCGYYEVNFKNAPNLMKGLADTSGQWKYTYWEQVSLDLTNYIGKMLTIEFITTDCFQKYSTNGTTCSYTAGTHAAYAYIDMYCTPIEIIGAVICSNQNSIELCAPPGKASYRWPWGQPGLQPPFDKKCITVKTPNAGNQYIVETKSLMGGCPSTIKIVLQGNDFSVKDATMCYGDAPLKLSANPTTPGKYTFKWEPQVYLDNPNIQFPTFTPGQTTTYTVTMIDEDLSKCNQVKKLTVTVNEGKITVDPEFPVICEGEAIDITASGATSYTWQPGNMQGATVSLNPILPTTYTVSGSSSINGCMGQKEVFVKVDKIAVVNVQDKTIHAGESVSLDGAVSGAATSGTWSGGMGTFIPNRNDLNATYKPTTTEEAAGSVQLTLTSNDPIGRCTAESKTMTLTILPAVTEILTFNQNNIVVEVYPNPFNTVLNINASGLTTSSELKLFDYSGKEVRSISLKNGLQKLDRSNLANGIYFMEIRNKANLLQKKKIVIND